MKKLPQPIPYQGSKRGIANHILKFLPAHIDRLVEPFAGSATLSIAASYRNLAQCFWLNELNQPLANLLQLLIEQPVEIADHYQKLWEEQLGQERTFYDEVRAAFNRTHAPILFLYLSNSTFSLLIKMNPLHPPITAVIFDMDGLMIDTERMAQRAWQRAGAEFGFTLPDELYLQAVGRTAKATELLFQTGLGADFPFAAVYERKQHYLYTAIEQEGIPTKPGLLELLDLVDEQGLAKAVATSTARVLALKKLTAAALLHRFDTLVCGDEVPNGKPSPDIFLAAATKLGIAPAHCLVLEDSSAGIKAAHAAEMRAIWVPDLIQPTAEITPLAYRVLPDLHQVIELLSS